MWLLSWIQERIGLLGTVKSEDFVGFGIWSGKGEWNVGFAAGVTAMAGIALAATLVISSRRGGLRSPWSRRKRKHALSPQKWSELFSPEGKLKDETKFLKKVRSRGIDPRIRADVWPFLLGVYDLSSTQSEREAVKSLKRKEYKKLRRRCQELLKLEDGDSKDSAATSSCVLSDEDSSTNAAISSEITSSDLSGQHPQQGLSGSIKEKEEEEEEEEEDDDDDNDDDDDEDEDDDDDVRSSVTQINVSGADSGTSDTDTSPQELKSLPASTVSTAQQAAKLEHYSTWQRIIRLDALRANAEWVEYSPTQAATSGDKAAEMAGAVGLQDYEHLEPCRIFHAARLVAVLEAYAVFDPEIGYCQGMSDLLSPIVAVVEEDAEAFWCFVGFMRKARHNFRLDEVGIRRQLGLVARIIKHRDGQLYRHLVKLQAEDCFFVYRMVVVLFRRELSFEQTLCLWEVVWADQAAVRAGVGKSAWDRIRQRAPPTEDLLLYAIAACVLQRRKLIIERYSSIDEILRECNSMAGRLDVWKLLDDAHDLVVALHDKV